MIYGCAIELNGFDECGKQGMRNQTTMTAATDGLKPTPAYSFVSGQQTYPSTVKGRVYLSREGSIPAFMASFASSSYARIISRVKSSMMSHISGRVGALYRRGECAVITGILDFLVYMRPIKVG